MLAERRTANGVELVAEQPGAGARVLARFRGRGRVDAAWGPGGALAYVTPRGELRVRAGATERTLARGVAAVDW